MEVMDDSLPQSYEFIDASSLDKSVVLPEGCTTATITTDDGETVTLIISEPIPDGDAAALKDILSGQNSDVILGASLDVDSGLATNEIMPGQYQSIPDAEMSDNVDSLENAESKNDDDDQEFVRLHLPGKFEADEPDNVTTNLEDFMDEVKSYKCKYCRFTCPWKSGLVSHIRCCHDTDNRRNLSLWTRHIKEPNIVNAIRCEKDSPSDDKNASSSSKLEEIQLFNDHGEEEEEVEEIVPDKLLENHEAEESDVDIASEKDASFLERHVFLCGQCSEGFLTLSDCRQHMINDHKIRLRQTRKRGQSKRGRPRSSSYGSRSSSILVDSAIPSSSILVDSVKTPRRVGRPRKYESTEFISYIPKRTKRKLQTDKYFRCQLQGCYQKFSTEEFLKYHYNCHDDSAKSFICKVCGEKFELWRLVVMHLWKEHSIDIDLVTCPDCDYKTYSQFKMENHRRIHSSERPFLCQICKKGFKQESQLRNHIVIHMDRKNLPIKRWYSEQDCDLCGRKFSDAKCLKKHQQAVHSKLKPFVCPYCGHMSARKAMLQLHIRQHTGEKPFQCDSCEYRTGDHNSLRRHRMRHTGTKPYKCPHCSYACIQAISYKTHLKNKHPGMDGIYSCELCRFKSVSRDNYVNHMSDHERRGLPLPSSPERPKFQFEVIPRGDSSVNMDLGDNALQQLEGILPGNITAAQLIYSCLNALSDEGGPVNLPPGVTVNLPTTTATGTDGTQTITIQLPTGQGMEPYCFSVQPDAIANNLDEEDVDDPDKVNSDNLENVFSAEVEANDNLKNVEDAMAEASADVEHAKNSEVTEGSEERSVKDSEVTADGEEKNNISGSEVLAGGDEKNVHHSAVSAGGDEKNVNDFDVTVSGSMKINVSEVTESSDVKNVSTEVLCGNQENAIKSELDTEKIKSEKLANDLQHSEDPELMVTAEINTVGDHELVVDSDMMDVDVSYSAAVDELVKVENHDPGQSSALENESIDMQFLQPVHSVLAEEQDVPKDSPTSN